MIIERVAEHSYCPELMTKGGYVLDLGCRGFQFTDYFRDKGHTVISVDIDSFDRHDYLRMAITGRDGMVGIDRNNDPQATKVKLGHEIQSMTLESFIKAHGIEFDLIKLDIEGSEYEVIMSLTKAPAKQISFECHCHTGAYSIDDVADIIMKLESLGYTIVQHELTKNHGCGLNFWDSLAILKYAV